MKAFSPVLLCLVVVLDSVVRVALIRCHSCFAVCSGLPEERCDCVEEGECQDDFCFARIIPFEGHLAISKGCTSDNILGQTESLCIPGSDDSLDCVCSQRNFCNGNVPSGPMVTPAQYDCCAQGRDDVGNCASTCRGDYCFDDRLVVEKGCGYGRPGLLKMLNIQAEVKSVCAELFYGSPAKTFLQNGCVCTGWRCNYQLTPMGFHRAKVLCHQCHIRGNLGDPDYVNTCNKRGRCVGNFCFVQQRTEEFTQAYDDYENKFEAPRVESTAVAYFGCLNMESKAMGLVRRGCLQEFSDGHKLSYQQCICDSHLCNSPEIVTNESFVVGSLKDGYVLPITEDISTQQFFSLPTNRPAYGRLLTTESSTTTQLATAYKILQDVPVTEATITTVPITQAAQQTYDPTAQAHSGTQICLSSLLLVLSMLLI